jgi:pimeloyl-ACP methyl ester carboxylesterase
VSDTSEVSIPSRSVALYGVATEAGTGGAPTILLLPGVGFHSFEYADLARLLAGAGFSSLAFDYRGHGRSGGKRGRWTLADLVVDTRAAIDWVTARRAEPVVAFGNSLGAMVAIRTANADDRIAAVAASNCAAKVADFLLTPMRRILFASAKAVAPILPVRISLNHFYSYDQLIDNPAWIRRISSDPLIGEARRLSIATYRTLIDEWDGTSEVRQLAQPLLLVQGTRDAFQPGEQTELLYAAARAPKARVRVDTGHLPHLERPDLLVECLAEWLERTLRALRR